MISLSTARRLKEAGLIWIPALHDLFIIPDRDLDDRVFVINDMMASYEIRQQLPMVTFHGTVEWALDYLVTSEIIWLPREDQLRMNLMRHLQGEVQPALSLSSSPEGYHCLIRFQGEELIFSATEASEAYGNALLHVLENPSGNQSDQQGLFPAD